MELHNYYTVRVGGRTHTAFNSLAEDFWLKAANFSRWANFLSLTAQDGTRVSAPAALEFLNCDCSRGGVLRASYRAEVICEQKRYVSAELCCEDGAAGVMSSAEIDVDGGGESAEITATIMLSAVAGEGVCLSAGNNPLIKRLLGCGDETEFEMGWGECDYPAVPCVRSSDLMGEILPADFVFDGNMNVSSRSPMQGCELVLYGGGESALRAVRPYTVSARSVAANIDSRRAVLLSEKPIESIYELTVDGTKSLRINSGVVAKAAFAAIEGKVRNLGADGEIKSDPDGEYIAFITTGYVEVYEVDVLDAECILRVERTDEEAEICRGGSLAMWNNSSLVIHERAEDGTYSSFSTAFPASYDRVIVREGDRYHCGYRRSTAYYRFEVTRAGKRQLEQVRVTSALFFAGRCGDAIAYGDKKLYVKTIDTDISADYACAGLALTTQLRDECVAGENFVITEEGGVTKLYDLVHDRVDEIEKGLKVCGNLAFGNGSAYAYDYYNGMRKIEGNYRISGATGACLTRRGLWVLLGGKLYAYYLSGGGTAVLMPAGSAGKQAVIGVRERNYEGLGKKAKFIIGGNNGVGRYT